MPKGGGGGGGGGGGHRRWMGDSRELDPEVTSWLVSTRARAKCSGQVQESNGKGEEVCREWNGSLVWKTEESKERMQGRYRRALAR